MFVLFHDVVDFYTRQPLVRVLVPTFRRRRGKRIRQRFFIQAKALGLELTYVDNKVAHQHGNTECGMYSLYMIISLLKETPHSLHQTYSDFIQKEKRIQDKDMETLRHKLFNFQSDE